MKNKVIIIASIIVIVFAVIGIIYISNKHNNMEGDTPIYTTQEGAVVNRDAIIVTTDDTDDFVDQYIIEDYKDISWKIGKDVLNPDITEIYEYLQNSSDVENINDVYSVEVYNSDKDNYRYYLSVKEAGSIISIHMP